MTSTPQPNFLVIGAPKAATTTLCDLLAQHPDVYLFPRKGTQFFTRRYDFGWPWYLSLFKHAGDAKAIGEGTPSYTSGRNTDTIADRIHHHLPDARLIYVVRHPIDRIESHYVQQLDNGRVYQSLGQALRQSTSLIDTSKYWTRISDYRRHYPDERILVLFFEDLRDNPAGTARRCFEFLGVDLNFQLPESGKALNARETKRTDRALMRWIRRHRGYVKLHWLLPRRLTNMLKPLLRKPLRVEVTWDEDARRYVAEQLTEDVRQFLTFYGKPADYWRLDPQVKVVS